MRPLAPFHQQPLPMAEKLSAIFTETVLFRLTCHLLRAVKRHGTHVQQVVCDSPMTLGGHLWAVKKRESFSFNFRGTCDAE